MTRQQLRASINIQLGEAYKLGKSCGQSMTIRNVSEFVQKMSNDQNERLNRIMDKVNEYHDNN